MLFKIVRTARTLMQVAGRRALLLLQAAVSVTGMREDGGNASPSDSISALAGLAIAQAAPYVCGLLRSQATSWVELDTRGEYCPHVRMEANLGTL